MAIRGAKKTAAPGLKIEPLTPERWDDFERLFGPRGACGGCWCMTPRLSRAEYEKNKGAGNRRAMKRLVGAGRAPGILAYRGKEPVGWCSVEPRSAFPKLDRSRLFRPVDDAPVWSIVCLFVPPEARGQGVSRALIEGAVRHAARGGAKIVEAYPVEPKKKPMPAVFAWTGIASAFLEAGFVEVARRADTRPIVRRRVRSRAG